MDWSVFANIATVISSLAILAAVSQVIVNKKQLYFGAVSRCIDKFRDLGNLKEANEGTIVKYIDLVNEELFYMQHHYIPGVVSREWIDGMLDYLPVFNNNGSVLNEPYVIPLLAHKHDMLLQGFPRILFCFILRGQYDFKYVYSTLAKDREERIIVRKRIIEEVLNNITLYEM